MTPTEIITSLGIGLFTGFLSGLLGIGGGALGTPLIRLLLGVPAIISLATTMPVMLPSAASGAIVYFREKKIDHKLAGWLLIVAVPMTWLGADLTTYIPGRTLMLMTAIFLLIVGSSFLIRRKLLKDESGDAPFQKFSIMSVILVGGIGGLLAGLLAIGGGIIYVPALIRIFKRPMKVALATSLIIVMAVSIPGTIEHARLGHIDWGIAAIISIGVIPAAFLGAKLALRLRNITLERIFGISTMIFGLYFLISQW